MARILVAGVAVADFVFQVEEMPTRAEKYRSKGAAIVGGGCAANAAVAIARHGGKAVLATRLGDDPVGSMIAGDLADEGVDLSLANIKPGARSSFSSVYVDQTGERQIMSFRGSDLSNTVEGLEGAGGFDAVLADNRWPPLTRQAIALGQAIGVPVVIDAEAPVEVDAITGATHVAFSMQGLVAFTGENDPGKALALASGKTAAWLCVTDGERGVTYLANDETGHVPAFAVDARDTLGAGDIWHGVFAWRLAEGDGERDAIVFANAAAALKCRSFGGRASCPTYEETEKFLSEHTIPET